MLLMAFPLLVFAGFCHVIDGFPFVGFCGSAMLLMAFPLLVFAGFCHVIDGFPFVGFCRVLPCY